MYDVIIIGGGPAGITAAVYASRKKQNTLLITKEFGGQILWTNSIENYTGYHLISGLDLITKFEEHVKQFPVNVVYDDAAALTVNDDGTFSVRGALIEYQGKTVIVASGKRPRRLNVPGESDFMGRGIAFCVTCDGPLYAGKDVAVVGGGNSGVQAALELSGIAQSVYLIVRDGLNADAVMLDKLALAPNLTVMTDSAVKGIYGQDAVEKVTVNHSPSLQEKELLVQGIFVEIGLEPNSEFVSGLVDRNQNGEIQVDCRGRTNISGLFAAGDVTSVPDKQIVIAAGDGAKAALVACEYLLRLR
ncbi:MAG: FAD-dependent oxidoreductase [Negativicutes bacterium]|nr:FAD-dependent oxidoreductase [Negativicutes bacterium]